jgi:hypothetical protein
MESDPFDDRPSTPQRHLYHHPPHHHHQQQQQQMPSAFPLAGGLPSSFNSPSVHWGEETTTPPRGDGGGGGSNGVYPPGIQVPSPFYDDHHHHHNHNHETTALRHHEQQPSPHQQHPQHRPLARGNPFGSVTPSPSPSLPQRHQAPPPPLTIVARVRAFLGKREQEGVEPQAYVSVVARNRLVVVNPGAFGGMGTPDVVIGLAAAVNKLAAEDAGELAASVDSQEWARAFELDRAFW